MAERGKGCRQAGRIRAAQGKPLRIGLIGAGKFGFMYLAQLPRTPGIHLVGIAGLSVSNARASLERVGWPQERFGAASLQEAISKGTTHVSDDWQALVNHPEIEIIAECTATRLPRSSTAWPRSNRASAWST